MSQNFQQGQTVWRAWAYVDSFGTPVTRIRKATYEPTDNPHMPLLKYEDGRAEFVFSFGSAERIYATREGAVLHCIRVFADVRWRIEDAIDRLQAEPVEHSGGPAPGNDAPAGTAPPEVAR
jgi:hypothetical protein